MAIFAFEIMVIEDIADFECSSGIALFRIELGETT
jgi:hypothetical protein